VRHIVDIQYTAVDTEFDALLLDNNLIKEYRPRYNVMLKDDKTYPWLCLTHEDFPKLFLTRKRNDNDCRYFGPYASVKIIHMLLDTLMKLFKLRRCKLYLTEKNTRTNKFKPCLDYHIGNCTGVCAGKQNKKEYQENIQWVVLIIEGDTSFVINHLREKMMAFSSKMAFEKAHEIKLQLQLLEKYQAKSTIVSETIRNVDVFAIDTDVSTAYVCYFNVVNGAIVKTHTLSVKQQLDESYEDILLYAVVDIRRRFASNAQEIIVPYPLDFDIGKVKITVAPKQGEKRHLLQLAHKNAMEYKHNMQKQQEFSNPEKHRKELLETMQKDLLLPVQPAYIECFDNSNIQGKFPVSSMVCFRNGKPSVKEYRIFNVRDLDTPDDFSTMEEVIQRRYSRLQTEGSPLPDLIIVDGGKGQVSAAYNVLKALNLEKIPLLGIAKRLEEIYRPDDPIPLFVDKKSETQRVIQHIRDEAHRFAISHHRKRRDKALMKTELTNIQGIGEATAAKLLSIFRSVSVIKNTKMEDLEKIVGAARASTIYNFYHT
jgi:excinuclease ABC subunit C